MPIYDFECTSCGNCFETLLRASDPAPTCEHCKAPARRLPSLCSHHSATAGGATTGGSGSSCSGCTSNNCSNCR
ncbi:MAG: zinc ribbon domain-containing protein [Candidatus Alcyoniella australis]|nr:zinc ribbon domain-containing protein [Candidatus Alcyoniella australis]